MNFNKKNKPKSRKSAFKSLTAAALILPGLLVSPASVYAADDDEVDFQYSHYQEGKRDIYIDTELSTFVQGPAGSIIKAPNPLNPIEVDSVFGHSRISLTDRVKFGFNYTQDTWAGATPIATAPVVASSMSAVYNRNTGVLVGASPLLMTGVQDGSTFLDLKGNFYDYVPGAFDIGSGSNGPKTPGVKNNQLTHVMVSASPETRQQGDFKLSYEWDNAAVTGGGGLSVENDYDSRFGNLGLRLDFNQKRTSVNWGVSYTNSDTHATMDPYSFKYVSSGPYDSYNGAIGNLNQVFDPVHPEHLQSYSPNTQGTLNVDYALTKNLSGIDVYAFEKATLLGNRQDWATDLGLTQVLTKNAQLEAGLSYTHSGGFLSNPYKAVNVYNIYPSVDQDPNQPLLVSGGGRWEARPHERNQINGNLGYQYYIEPLNAALHARYTFAHDDWGINAHTFSADWVQPLAAGWTVTPRVRYYSQSAADFYAPYFTTVTVSGFDAEGNTIYPNSPLNKVLPEYYSSDQRLSGFGALSGGITIAKQFAKGVSLETGFEYYTHQGALKLGGGSEQAFADYDYWVANAALKLNLGALRFGGGHSDTGHDDHHQAVLAPAGIMFNHALKQARDMMVGYRYMRSEQAGSMLAGSSAVSNDTAISQACDSDKGCMMTPNQMTMNMHMLDLMVAPTDWLTLMLMPQWTDMSMSMSSLPIAGMPHTIDGEMYVTSHQTGGIGDTGLYALFKLFDRPGHQLVLSLGGTAPTGDVNLMKRRNDPKFPDSPLDYGMQLGSGTWDLKPSLTYSGGLDDFTWGAQATGTKRLETRNQSGYALGDLFQSSVWGGYQWTNWLSSTVRGVYTWQDSIRGKFNPVYDTNNIGPVTAMVNTHVTPSYLPSNYGGKFVDLGLGVSVTVPSGTFAGNTIKFEWLQPVHTDYNGYQLDRSAALTATWGVGF